MVFLFKNCQESQELFLMTHTWDPHHRSDLLCTLYNLGVIKFAQLSNLAISNPIQETQGNSFPYLSLLMFILKKNKAGLLY